jgi:hypothetical protein
MLREIVRKSYRAIRRKLSGRVDLQELLNKNNVQMSKTREYESDDEDRLRDPNELQPDEEFDIKPWGPPGVVMVWSYRFKFDNQDRKRRFMKAIEDYPEQEWDAWIKWQDDISNYQGEITSEAMVRVPPEKAGWLRHHFELFVTRELVLKE